MTKAKESGLESNKVFSLGVAFMAPEGLGLLSVGYVQSLNMSRDRGVQD